MGVVIRVLVADVACHRNTFEVLKPQDLRGKSDYVVCLILTLQVQRKTKENILEYTLLITFTWFAE